MRLLIKIWIKVFFQIEKIAEKIILYFKLKYLDVDYREISTFNGIPFIINNGRIIIKKNVVINSKYRHNPIGGNTFTTFWTKKEGIITIESGARISNSSFVSEKEIYIGKNVYIGGDCKIYDTDFHSLQFEKRIQKPDVSIKSAKVIIKDGAFIGTGTIIMKGVTIGQNSVVGAGSVVVKDIPENEIWGGNPVRFIRKL